MFRVSPRRTCRRRPQRADGLPSAG
uniref:SFRICE_005144 n=1 Tax=Spodoptera frugiperda TaxID=7108 RepID=A0A2H1V4D0_SPOFR